MSDPVRQCPKCGRYYDDECQRRFQCAYALRCRLRRKGAADVIQIELVAARARWPTIRSAHEGASLVQEELEEYRAAIHEDQSVDNDHACEELIQTAAMCIRTLEDVYRY